MADNKNLRINEQIPVLLVKESAAAIPLLDEAFYLVRALNPAISICALHGLGGFRLGDPQPAEAAIVAPMAEMVILYPWMIKQAHRTGQQVYVWFGVAEQPLVIRLLLALGVDGLMVDDLASAAKILGRNHSNAN